MNSSERVAITQDIIQRLDKEIKRTGMSPRVFFQHKCQNPPEGLRAHTIDNWLSGRTAYTEKHILDYVMTQYENSPNETIVLNLTDDRLEELGTALTQANRTPAQIVRLAGQNAPKGLNAELISKWKRGKVKTAKRIQWDFVINFCEKLTKSQDR